MTNDAIQLAQHMANQYSTRAFARRSFLALAGASPFFLEGATLEQVRLGVTSDEIDEDVAVAAEFLHSFGLGYAEIRSIWGKYNTSQPIEKVREARALLDARNVRTSILGTAFFRGTLPAENPEGQAELDAQWKLLDDAFARAEILG